MIVGVWGVGGVGVWWRGCFGGGGNRRADFCAAGFEFADLRGLELTGVHILCAGKHQKRSQNRSGNPGNVQIWYKNSGAGSLP